MWFWYRAAENSTCQKNVEYVGPEGHRALQGLELSRKYQFKAEKPLRRTSVHWFWWSWGWFF